MWSYFICRAIYTPRGALFKPFNMSLGAKIQKNDVCLRGVTHQSGTSDTVYIEAHCTLVVQ
jgi:hypothetical protein